MLNRGKSAGTIVIAHRGASAYAPENTMAAFEEALRMKADMVELDLQTTRDGRWVVMHDFDLKRTCGRKLRIAEMTGEEIGTLEAGSWFSKRFFGEKIPRLEEVLEWAGGKISLNLEIKGESVQSARDLELLVKQIHSLGITSEILVSSFNWNTLRTLRNIDRELHLGLLVNREGIAEYLQEALLLRAFSIHLPGKKVTPKVLAKIDELTLPVYVYTLNSLREIEKFIKLGVAGFFTNFPDRGIKARELLRQGIKPRPA